MTKKKLTIPEKLRNRNQWVVWKYGQPKDNGKTLKIPIDPKTGELAIIDDRRTWGSFKIAIKAFVNSNLNGVGFVFSKDDEFCGIVLNNCRNKKTGEIEKWACKIIKDVGSYTEASTSGTGVKIIAEGKLPGPSKRNGKIEMYDHHRYFSISGQYLGRSPKKLRKKSNTIKIIYNIFFKEGGINADNHSSHCPQETTIRI